MGELTLCVVLFTCAPSVGYTRWVSLCFVWFSLLMHAVRVTPDGSARALCGSLHLCTSAGYIRWVSLLLVWYSLCGLHQMGELALCMALFTSARSAGYTRWVNLRFLWYTLLVHVVWVTPDG